MSVVVAVRDTDRIWLVADSQVTLGGNKGLLTSSNSFKIFKNGENCLMGVVGSLRDANILSTASVEFVDPLLVLKNQVDFKSIVRETVPKIFEELAYFKRVSVENGMCYLDSQVLIATGKDCFSIYSDGAVLELDEMFAIGSGADVAESAYTILMDTTLTAKEKAIKAAISSCERDLYVAFPIVITNTFDYELEIFDGNVFYRLNENNEFVEVEEEEEAEEEEVKTEKED